MKLVLYGPSGSGKTTSAGFVADWCAASGRSCDRIPLAEPLYRLQAEVYSTAGRKTGDGVQDQLLMEALAAHLRRINPQAFVEDFRRRLDGATADVIVNNDLRDPHVDAPALREAGFRFIRVYCPAATRWRRLRERGDLTIDPDEPSAREIDLIAPNDLVDNGGSLEQLRAQILRLLGGAA